MWKYRRGTGGTAFLRGFSSVFQIFPPRNRRKTSFEQKSDVVEGCSEGISEKSRIIDDFSKVIKRLDQKFLEVWLTKKTRDGLREKVKGKKDSFSDD